MKEWAAKRFWTEATVTEAEGGFGVALDGRRVTTPLKSALVLPNRAMAEAAAAEWNAQEGKIAPLTMPVTRSANSAIDKVAPQRREVIDMLAAYGASDVLCYRAAAPDALVARQVALWDPWLAWSGTALGAPLAVTAGVLPVDQPPESLARLRGPLDAMDVFELTAMHDLVSLSGSLVLAFAVAEGQARAADLWPVSRLDELWQQEQWGADDEAESMAAERAAAFLHAERFLALARGSEPR